MTVSIVRDQDGAKARDAIGLLGGMKEYIEEKDKVIIKPNICAGKVSQTGAVTDPEVVAEICKMVEECGASPTVAESPIYPFPSKGTFRRAGYGNFEEKYGFPLIDLNSQEQVDVRVPHGKAVRHLVISKPVLDCDKIINVPVMKTHIQTMVSLGLKNLKGVVPGRHKHIIHIAGLDEGIVDLNTIIKPDLTVVDGIIGMEGHLGPVSGSAVNVGVIVAGDNVVEVDSVCARIMGADPHEVEHINLAWKRGLGSIDLEDIEIKGEDIGKVMKKLELPTRPRLDQLIMSGGLFFRSKVLLRGFYRIVNLLAKLFGYDTVDVSKVIEEVVIDADKCTGCKLCVKACPVDAMSFDDIPVIDDDVCIRCFCCAEVCPEGAISRK